MGLVCGACGGANRDGARFCGHCGVRNVARCVTCDAELAEGLRFCDSCGAPVGESDDGPPGADQARKTVTVLFADLAGSTAMQEEMDPEAVRGFMARYYRSMQTAVDDNGGRVVKFVGDAVMAAFGVPEVAEDDAYRSLCAATAMHDAFTRLVEEERAELGVALGLRIGINTGEVVVEEGDDDVVGDAVNVAARLEHAAPAGAVLVGDDTYRLARARASFGPPRQLEVRGRAEPVAARVLESLEHQPSDVRAAFVGRSDELAVLVGALGTAEAMGRARLVTVVGSPGVGKSRLLDELEATVSDAATVLRARCDQRGNATLAPIRDVLRAAIALGPGLDQVLADDPERDRVVSAVGALVGDGQPETPQETFWAVRRVIEATSRHRPTVVVLDDLHWAEPMLLDLVEHLAEWLSASPVLLVAAGRPELRELRPALVEVGSRPRTVVSLEGLDPDTTAELAAELLGAGALPLEVVARVVAATEGNPLFVRELVRMLVDDGVLRPEGGGWVVAVDPREIDVPPTIASLLAARIERLQVDERTVLERAAVIGHEVVLGALVDLLPAAGRAHLDAVLESLRRKELLEPVGSYWIDEPVLRFHHVLIRDAAYRRLLREARADLHERAARWLAAKTGGGAEHDELIGFHLEQAQANRRELGPLDEHELAVAAEAASRLSGAAHRALHRDDLPAAATLSARALACLEAGDASRAELLLIRCEAVLGTGDTAAARPAVDELRERAGGDERLSAWATSFAIQLATLTGGADLDECGRRASEAAAQLTAMGDPTGAAKAYRVRALVLARLGQVADTEAALDLALTAAREAGDSRQISGVLAAAPLAALWGPTPVARAGGRCLDVVRLLRITTGARAVEAISTRCQAVLEALRGRTDAARKMLDGARATLEDLGLRHGLLELELFAGIVELAAGEPAAADDHLRIAYDGFRALGIDVDAAQAAAIRARAALAVGEDDRALELVEVAESLGAHDLKTAIAWRTGKAEVLARRGRHAQAIELAEAAAALAEPTDALLDRADAQAALGAVLTLAGDVEGGRRATERARSLYEQKGATALAERLGPDEGVTQRRPPDTQAPRARPPRVLENHATRAFMLFTDAMARGEARSVQPEGSFSFEDRRRGLGTSLRGVGAAADAVGHLPGLAGLEREVLAVRGERWCLAWGRYEYLNGFVNESLSVLGTDGNGAPEFTTVFDTHDLAEALRELDQRAAEGAPDPPTARAVSSFGYGFNTRQWDVLAGACDRDLVHVDHRPASFEESHGVAATLERLRGLAEVAPDHRVINRRALEARPGATLGHARVQAGVPASGPTMEMLVLFFVREGRITRYEIFGIDDEDVARARLTELTGEPANAATRTMTMWGTAFVDRRWDDLARFYSDDFVHVDRRTVIGGDHFEGGAAADARRTDLAGMGVSDIRSTVIAVRGDRLALRREVYVLDRGFEMELLHLCEVDDEGRQVFGAIFDASDLGSALALLEERDLRSSPEPPARLARLLDTPAMRAAGAVAVDRAGSGEVHVEPIAVRTDRLALQRVMPDAGDGGTGTLMLLELDATGEVTDVVEFDERDLAAATRDLDERMLAMLPADAAAAAAAGHRMNLAQRAGDADALAACVTDDFEFVDHQLLGAGTLPSDEFVVSTASRSELTAERLDVVAVYFPAPNGGVSINLEVGVLAGGGGYEVPRVILFTARGGQVDRAEVYDDDQLDAALARLKELEGSDRSLSPPPPDRGA